MVYCARYVICCEVTRSYATLRDVTRSYATLRDVTRSYATLRDVTQRSFSRTRRPANVCLTNRDYYVIMIIRIRVREHGC